MAELGSILLRRGTTAERETFVPLKGEIIYDTELKQVFVGDGETYGGRTVYNDAIIADSDGNIKVGDNLAVILGDDGIARSLRLPGGTVKERGAAIQGALRYNTEDATIEFSDGNEWFFLNKNVVSGNVIELYVSLDGHDDRRYGKQRGRSMGTAFRTLNMACREAEDIVNANPETEPFVNEEQPYRRVQVLIHIASGIYEEHLPIRVPANTSLFGSGQRRCTVRPKAGVPSESPWAKMRFWRETDDHPNGYFGHHYLTDPSDAFSIPKDNTDIDIFLCNDTNWFHDFGTDLHNSFCFVLDPEGQILTKSPYPHTGVCFAKSSFNTNPYEVGFHGGMFADGFTGNQDFNIEQVLSDGAIVASGFWRKPLMPTAFYADGYRYQAESVESDGTGYENAVQLLELNKSFIQEETIQFVNDKYLFTYNEDKCRRDLNLILTNVGYDIVLGTNFLTHFTSNSYLRPNSAYVLTDQNEETVGGINYAKGQANTSLSSHTPTQAKNTELFNNIIDTIENQTLPTVYWPNDVYDDNKNSVRKLLVANTEFIKEELIAWINYQVRENISPFNTAYVYDQTKCRRDTELVINAVIFDLMFGGNYATTEIARSYWMGITSQVPTQQQQHKAAFDFVGTLIDKILANDSNIDWGDKFQLEIPQQLLDLARIDNSYRTKSTELITVIGEVILYGTNYAPIVVYPDIQTLYNNRPPLFKDDLQRAIDARRQLVTDVVSIIDSSIAFINTAYASFTYNEDVCRRDVGLIIDAMKHDLLYGGEVETVKAGWSYFETGSTVIAEQEAETVDAINYTKYLALNVIQNSVPSKVFQTEIAQVQDSTYEFNPVDDAGALTKVENLFGIITNIISNYNEIKAAHDLLENNKEWIQDEVIAFIAATYPSLTYNTAICRRDTGFIISSISNDLFGGFIKSEQAGISYYRGASSVGDTDVVLSQQRDETIAANEYARSLVAQVLNNSTSNSEYLSSPYQSSTSQTTNAITVSSSLKQKADDCYGIIIDIIGEAGESAGPGSLPKYKVNVASSTPIPDNLDDRNLVMITAGNKSFVATDWTMFGNLGYGVLARNNARCELVSIFTYYCGYTYKAESGSEVRSLNGSSSNGIYGLGAEGRNPFEVPVNATTVNETVFVAEADSTVVGDNAINDLQIVIRNAVDTNGDAAELFNTMVAEVDHGGATGIVRYEIGNFQGNTLNIRGSAQGLVAAIPDGNDITLRLLQEYEIDTNQDISDLLLGAALIYDDDPDTGYRIINLTPEGVVNNRFVIRALPTLNHISVVVNGTVAAGNNQFVINAINYGADTIEGRRLGYKGTVYRVTDFDTNTNTITLHTNLNDDLTDQDSVKLSPAPGATGKIFTDFSIVKAGNHDMLDVGTGAYEDSNYPRELYGPPERPAVQTQEVDEIAPGRVFFVTNDQDGNFRVGDYFRVNQGDGSVSFSAAIALSNLDGLGFTRGVTINEFSADSDMIDISDEAVPTEQAVVNYINKRLGQDKDGTTVGANRIGAGVLMLDGSQPMEGALDMDGNNIIDLGSLGVDDITADTIDVNTSATIATLQVEDLTTDRVVIAGASGELQDYSTFRYDGNTLSIDSDPSTVALSVNGQFNLDGDLNHTGSFFPTGDIIPVIPNSSSLGSSSNPFAELYLGPGSLYINNKKVISDEADEITIGTLTDQNVRIAPSGTGQITLASHVTAPSITTTGDVTVGGTLDAQDITVDNIVIDDTTVTINGNIIQGTGSAASGTITITPGFTGANLGSVSIVGNLDVTGQLNTTSTTLTNQLISGNLTVQGNTIIGDSPTDSFVVEASLNSDIIPLTNNSRDIGTDLLRLRKIFITDIDSKGLIVRDNGNFIISDNSDTTTFEVTGSTGDTVIHEAGNFTIKDNTSPIPIDVFTVNGSSGTTMIRKGGVFRIYDNDASPNISFEASGTTGNVSVANNLEVGGNLTVSGTVISELTIEDNTVVLNSNYTGNPAVTGVNAGVEVERGTGANVDIRWNETDDKWQITNDGSSYDDIAVIGDVNVAAGDSRVDSLGYNTSNGVFTLTRGDASTETVDLDGRYVLLGGDSMTGTLNVDSVSSASANTNLQLSGNGTGVVEVRDNLYINDGDIIFEGTANAFETTLTKTDPTADRTITLPNATGTIAVSVSDTTTTTQGDLNLDFTLSATGDISATGDAHGLATGDSPTFSGITVDNAEVSGITLSESADRSRLISIVADSTDNWTGIQIQPTTTSKWSVMGDQNDFGLYDDENNEWILLYNENGTTQLYANGENSVTITTLGILVNEGNNIKFEGSTANSFETTLTVVNPTADRTISLPNATGTVAVSVSDTTTTTQGDLNLDFSLSAAGAVSATGDAHGLATTDTPTFAGLQTTSITTGDSSTAGSITGNWSLTTGSRLQATYADVAEIYSTDAEYQPGTIVMFGGEKELTISQGFATTKVAGVISSQYAFLMNNNADGQPVALKGRIPVKVQGPVSKGDFIVASNTPGVGIATDNYIGGAVLGKALEDKTTDDIELIEVKV